MTKLIKAMLKKSDDHTNITEYHIMSCLFFLRIQNSKIHDDKAIISVKNVKSKFKIKKLDILISSFDY